MISVWHDMMPSMFSILWSVQYS